MKHLLALLLLLATPAFSATAGISLLFTWDNAAPATEYRIYQEVPPPPGQTATTRVLVKAVSGTPAPKTAEVTGLAPGAYTFVVAAVYAPLETGQPQVEMFSPPVGATIPALTAPESVVVKIQFVVTAP